MGKSIEKGVREMKVLAQGKKGALDNVDNKTPKWSAWATLEVEFSICGATPRKHRWDERARLVNFFF